MSNLIEFSFEITNGCNLRCKHCIVNSGITKANEITYKDIENFVLSLDKRRNYIFKLTGGEPLFRKDIIKILNLLIDHKIKVEIITNGLLLNNEILTLIQRNNIKMGLSMESFNKENHEAIRGINTFDKTLFNLKKIISHKIDCCLYVTINKYNENEIDDIIYNCKKYNIPVHFNYLTYSGRAKTNKNDLMPTSNDLLKKIKNAYEKYYSNKIIKLPNSCWADASVLQLDSEGNIYYCTEINHYNNKNWLGNIKTFPINEWLNRNKSVSYENKLNKCPYDVYYGENIFITKNINKKCDFCYNNKKISTIKQLNKVFDDLYQEFEMNCNGCEYPDCMGYIWLTKQETKKLSNLGVDILTINEDINCINSLGDISVDTDFSSIVYPKCPLRCDKSYKCKIHDERPMVCHIYPVGLESAKNGSILWVLHKDCLFVKQLENKGQLELFMLKCNQLINSLSIELEETIISTFKKIDNVSSFPNGENRYYILKERRELYVKV